MTIDLVRKETKEQTVEEMEATSSQVGTVKKNKWQKKVLGTAVTTNIDVADLTSTSLTAGKTYRFTLQGRIDRSASDGNCQVYLYDGTSGSGTTLTYLYTDDAASSYAHNLIHSVQVIRTMLTGTVTTQTVSISSGTVLAAGASNTFLIIEELADVEETDEW